MNLVRSESLYQRAMQVTPGGVNSPVRAFGQVGGIPRFIARGEGAYMYDVDARRYIDYVGSWGPLILGHASEIVREAVTEALEGGSSFGAPTEREVLFAELLTQVIPGLEQVRFVSSGTEATMSALRLARGFTSRDKVIKFNGCYHGHADSFLVKAGSGVATFGIAGSSGIPKAVTDLCISIEFSDLSLLDQTLEALGPETVAAVIVEPVPGNMGLVLPHAEFLSGLRQRCTKHGIVLIFDEVMSGFRVALGGAQERFNVKADLSTFGKVIGGGLPVAAFGGRRDIMGLLAPLGPVYQAGTLSGNPLAMAAGLAVVTYLRDQNPYPDFEELGRFWAEQMESIAKEAGVPLRARSCGSMIGFFFTEAEVRNFSDAQACDIERFKRFFHEMLAEGVYLAPSAYETGFLSTAHTKDIISETLTAARAAFSRV